MTDQLFQVQPDAAAVRRAQRRKAEAEAVAADEALERAQQHLAALKAERHPALSRTERLRTHAKLTFVTADPTGLAPGPGLVVGGRLGDLLPQAEADFADLDRQIAEAESVLAELDL